MPRLNLGEILQGRESQLSLRDAWMDRPIAIDVCGVAPLRGRTLALLFGAARYLRFRDRDDPQLVAVLESGEIAHFPLNWCSLRRGGK